MSNQPVQEIRRGRIRASIWVDETERGPKYSTIFTKLYKAGDRWQDTAHFGVSRSWKLKSGEREGYSQNFFDSNADALADVIRQARDFIAGHAAAVTDQQSAAPRGGPRVTLQTPQSVDRA